MNRDATQQIRLLRAPPDKPLLLILFYQIFLTMFVSWIYLFFVALVFQLVLLPFI